MQVTGIFPTPIYGAVDIKQITELELDFVEKQKSKIRKNDGNTATLDTYVLEQVVFKDLKNIFEQHLEEYLKKVICPVETNIEIYITQSWLNVYPPTAFNPVHHHINSIISGVFYINCLEYSGEKRDGINFTNSAHEIARDIELPIAHSTIFSDKISNVSVATGDLVLFPSSVRHSVNINETPDQTRISLAFNAI